MGEVLRFPIERVRRKRDFNRTATKFSVAMFRLWWWWL